MIILLVLIVPTSGCIDDGDGNGKDYSDWSLAMTIDRFIPKPGNVVNSTYLLFDARFGPIFKDPWIVHESDAFVKGEENTFALRLGARYDDGVNEVEPFPIMGSENLVTGAITIRSGKVTALLDGDQGLYTKDNSIDRYPHDLELTVTLQGDEGDLRLYFNMNKPA